MQLLINHNIFNVLFYICQVLRAEKPGEEDAVLDIEDDEGTYQ